MDSDLRIRDLAIRHCRLLATIWGEAVPARELSKGFVVDGERIKLVSWSRGVFKPKQLQDGPLTVLSSLASRYEDEHLADDMMLYDYAPRSFEWANDGIKRLSELGRPPGSGSGSWGCEPQRPARSQSYNVRARICD